MEIKDALNSLKVAKVSKTIFKEPNTVTNFHGKDVEGSFEYKKFGKDVFTSHVQQNYNWNDESFNYKWNSLGLRGNEPDYNASKKIIFAGGSLSLGTGIPFEKSFPHLLASYLDASYINLSDADTFTDILDPIKKLRSFDPDYVVLSDTRFIQLHGWALIDIYNQKHIETNSVYKNIFFESDKKCLEFLDFYFKGLFPRAKIILTYCERRAWKNIVPNYENILSIPFSQDLVKDLARDNFHPGVVSHLNFASKIYNSII